MIMVRFEAKMRRGKEEEALALIKSYFDQDGPWRNGVKGYRIYSSYYSGATNQLVVESHYESLTDWDKQQQLSISAMKPEQFETFERTFEGDAYWSYWMVEEEG